VWGEGGGGRNRRGPHTPSISTGRNKGVEGRVDGYFADGSVKICTDNFTKEEVLILTKVLGDKLGIKATINKRSNANGNVV